MKGPWIINLEKLDMGDGEILAHIGFRCFVEYTTKMDDIKEGKEIIKKEVKKMLEEE